VKKFSIFFCILSLTVSSSHAMQSCPEPVCESEGWQIARQWCNTVRRLEGLTARVPEAGFSDGYGASQWACAFMACSRFRGKGQTDPHFSDNSGFNAWTRAYYDAAK
jgi:hypothetical protein